jgi:hypothetical protein
MMRVVRARVLEQYRLELEFSNGETRIADLSRFLKSADPDGVFAALKDERVFGRAEFDPVLGTVVWPGDVDLAPEALFDMSYPVPVGD